MLIPIRNVIGVLFVHALLYTYLNIAVADTLSAAKSDPKVMGWMQGFPPKNEKLITQPDSNYFSFPKLR